MEIRTCLILFYSFILLNFAGCVTTRLSPWVEPTRYVQAENKLLDSVNMTVKDQQFVGLAGEIGPGNFYSSSRKKPAPGQETQMTVTLHECEVVKPFWKNPWTLITILGLTAGNIYECKTSIEMKDLKNSISKNYETVTREYGFTGLAAIFWGADVGARLRSDKIDRVRATMSLYLKEKGMISH